MNSKLMRFLILSVALAAWGLAPALPAADAPKEGIVLAIVYDTSGSMRETVRDKSGSQTAKYIIANRALQAVAAQIEKFATNQPAGGPEVQAGLYTFKGNSATPVVPMGRFDRAAFDKFAASFNSPNGNTPLGNSLSVAWQAVIAAPGARKHVLVITDGANTEGPKPEETLPRLKQQAAGSGKSVSVHFVAFNVAAKEFTGVKKQGATVVGAADEKQLDTQLDFILQKKILLEDEEK